MWQRILSQYALDCPEGVSRCFRSMFEHLPIKSSGQRKGCQKPLARLLDLSITPDYTSSRTPSRLPFASDIRH